MHITGSSVNSVAEAPDGRAVAGASMAPTRPKVVILVLNWNGRSDTAECLESLARLDYQPVQVIVIDNGSTDGSVGWLRERFPQITLVENGVNLGFCMGNNIGIQHALAGGADYVMLLNNDATLAPDALTRLVAAGEADPAVGILGPKTYAKGHDNILYSAGIRWHASLGYGASIGLYEVDRGQYDHSCEREAIGGFVFLVKRAVLETIGVLDTDYFAYYEEVDFCMRARAAGYRCRYVAEAMAWHKGHGTNAGVLRAFLMQRNQLMFMRKRATLRNRLVFFAYFFLYRGPKLTLLHLVRGRFGELAIMMKAVLWHFGLFRRDNPVTAQSRGAAA